MVKSEKVEEKELKEFPKLMYAEKYFLTILFSSVSIGMVVVGNSAYNVGTYGSEWDMKYFSDMKGSITLSNE